MKLLSRWTPFALCLVLLAVLVGTPAAGQDAKPPEVVLPPNEVPKATLSFAKSQAEDVVDWSLKDVRVPEVWAKGITGKGGVADVLDTAGDSDHPDLKGQTLPGKSYTGESLRDRNGHGTWVMGHIAAAKDGKGMVGAAYGGKVRGRKVLSNSGSGSVTGIAKGIDDAVADGTDCVSGSLGGPQPDQWTRAAIEKAAKAGVMCIFAAGNDGPGANTVDWPGALAENVLMVCVAAHDQRQVTARFSSRGKAVTITLGGVDCQGLWLDGQYVVIDGTSMATPLCAALYLLWLEAVGSKLPKKDRPAAFLDALAKSCDQYPRRDSSRGYGKPDAVKLIGAITPPPPPPGGFTLTVTLADLSAAKQQELKDRGVTSLSLSATVGSPPAPAVTAEPIRPACVGTPPGPDYEWRPHGGVWGWVHKDVRNDPPPPHAGPVVGGTVPIQVPLRPLVPANRCPGGVCPVPPLGAPQRMPPIRR